MSNFDPTIENEGDDFEIQESEDVLKGMVEDLNELPTDVLQQLLNNLNEVEEYNKEHPEVLKDDTDK